MIANPVAADIAASKPLPAATRAPLSGTKRMSSACRSTSGAFASSIFFSGTRVSVIPVGPLRMMQVPLIFAV